MNFSFFTVLLLLLLVWDGSPFSLKHRRIANIYKSHDGRPHRSPLFLRTSKTLLNAASNDEHSQKKKILATTFNLVKAIAGSGVLALPSGVAAISNYKER